MINYLFLFLTLLFLSCEDSEKIKSPTSDPTSSESSQTDSPTPSDDGSDEFGDDIDEFGNRTNAGAGSGDPCQEDPPGPGCDPEYIDKKKK